MEVEGRKKKFLRMPAVLCPPASRCGINYLRAVEDRDPLPFGSGGIAKLVHLRDESRRDERDDPGVRFTNAGQIEPVFLTLAGAASRIHGRPELPLHEVFERGCRHPNSEEFGLGGAAWEGPVTVVDGAQEAKAA